MLDSRGYRVRVVVGGGEAVVEVAGELDLHARHDLLSALGQASSAGQRLVVDLSQTTFIDSTALKALLETWRAQNEAGKELVLRGPSPVVVRTLEIAGLSDTLTTEPADRPTD